MGYMYRGRRIGGIWRQSRGDKIDGIGSTRASMYVSFYVWIWGQPVTKYPMLLPTVEEKLLGVLGGS